MKLHKMSTTAGVGSGDYVAVNGTAIAAVVLGVATLLSLFHPALLFIPIAGVICSILAIRQVAESNGTQTGRALAIIGLLLSLGIGGWIGSKEISETSKTKADRQAVAHAIITFGDQLRDNQLNEAYQSTTARFKEQVTQERFLATMGALRNVDRFGALKGIDSNNLAQFTVETNGDRVATAAALMRFEKMDEPLRPTITLRYLNGAWHIESISEIFPATPAGGAQGGGPGAGPAGPPSPM